MKRLQKIRWHFRNTMFQIHLGLFHMSVNYRKLVMYLDRKNNR